MARNSKSGGVRLRTPAKMEEKHVRGRRAGVQGTYGGARGRYSNAERTIFSGKGNSDGGGEGMLGGTSRNLYLKALGNAKKCKRDKLGDGGLWER
jgi:hypothetical protein